MIRAISPYPGRPTTRPSAALLTTLAVVGTLALWVLTRWLLFEGLQGSDDLNYVRFAVAWDRVPINHHESRIFFIALLRGCIALFGFSEFTLALPALLGSLMIFACTWVIALRWGSLSIATWAGVLVAVLPLDVTLATAVSPYPLLCGLLAITLTALLWQPATLATRILAAVAAGLAVVVHLTAVFPLAAIFAGALWWDRRRYWRTLAAMALGILVFVAAQRFMLHALFGDAFLDVGVSRSAIEKCNHRSPPFVDGRFNPRFVTWPLETLVYSKAFGIALVCALAVAAWRFRSLTHTQKLIVVIAAIFVVWLSYGSQVPWAYKPFWRNTRFWQPLVPIVALLFGLGMAHVRPQRRWLLAGPVLLICIVNLAISGPWGQSVHASRELLAWAAEHPRQTFVTDALTHREMYVLNGVAPPANIVVMAASHRLAYPGSTAHDAAALVRQQALLLINPLNADRDPAFHAFAERHAGDPLFRGRVTYRDIARWLPPLQRLAWSVRRPAPIVATPSADALTATAP